MSYSVSVEIGAPLMFSGSEKIALLKHIAPSDYNASLKAGIMHTPYSGAGSGKTMNIKQSLKAPARFPLLFPQNLCQI